MRVVGVDGCRGGWIAVVYDIKIVNDKEEGTLSLHVHPSFQEVLDAYPDVKVICVDIPIGLREGPPPRACDIEARKVLLHKSPSVFRPPDPRVLSETVYEDALAKSRKLTGKGIWLAAFAMFPKLREVNQIVSPAIQDRVFEVHPEVCFWALAGKRPMTHPKSKPEGYEERRTLLAAELGHSLWTRKDAFSLRRPAKPDDVLDAIVAAWTARRVAEDREGRLPAKPEADARGLRMEMVF